MDDERDFTAISKNNKSFLQERPKTAAEIVEFLEHGAMYRDFAYFLSELYEGEDVQARLRRGFCEITGDPDEKVRKNVQNWMKGRSLPQNRETLFQICFILGFEEEKSSRLLGVFSENRIHYRDPEELAYAFALRTGRPYRDAVRLKEEALRIYEETCGRQREAREQIETLRRAGAAGEDPLLYTGRNRELFEAVQTEEAFYAFIRQNSVYLGRLHETAYVKFMQLLNLLQKPEETKYSMKQVAEDYFRMHVPETTRTGGMSAVQKLIKKCWPGETMLDKMKTRELDVSRKTLILLYLITGAFDEEVVDEEAYYYCDEEYTPDELFQIRCDQMDLFLKQYGMGTLDYGNPFDLIVLYALHPTFSGQEEEFASERIERVLEILYRGL